MSNRFTMSAPFTRFLETVQVEQEGSPLYLTCIECSERLCEIEDADTMLTLVVTLLKHDDECEARPNPTTPIQQEEA